MCSSDLAAVREAGRISRAHLVRRTGMARVTVNSLVTDLLAAGVLTEEAAAPTGDRAGRPARSLTLGPAAGGVVGAVIGADGVRVAEADLAGRILREHHHDIDTSDPSTALDAIAEVITGTGRVWSTVAGLSAPISGGVVQSSSVLPGWAGIAPATELSRRLGHRVIVRNDADLCLRGEVEYGVAAGHQDVCYLRVNSGIGCGLLLGGVVHHGATGVAGEIGHVQVDETGALCHCGNRGCLETIASPRQILGALSGSYGSPVTAAHAVELARSDATAERVMADAGRMIGRVVAALANGINPSLVVLDGPLIEPGGPVVLGVVESLHRYAQPEVVENTEVRVSALGGRAALLGSLAVALRGTPVARGSRALPESDPEPAVEPAPVASSRAPGSPAKRERAVRRDILVAALRGRGPTARSDLVKITRLPRAAVVELLGELRQDGIVELCTPAETRSGRPSPHFRLAVGAGRLIGLALAEPGIRAVVADGTGHVEETRSVPFPMSHDSHPMLRAAGDLAVELLERYGSDARIAVSVPSPVHPGTGRFGARSVLPMFSGFDPAEEIAAAVGRPVRAENNAQLAALAEMRRGAARGARDVLYLKADQHTGAGIIAGGRMHRGAIGYAGEVGHLNVREIGPLCICGSRGCLSAFLAPAYFGALLENRPAPAKPATEPLPAALDKPAEERLLRLAADGDRPAQRALLDAGRLIGRTVAPLCDVLNPGVVVVGGRFVEPGPHVVDGVREALQRHCAPSAAAGLTVVPAELGPDAEALGAIELLL